MKKTYFTSDLHLHHSNVINYCHRPFKDVEHMDSSIIDNWNSIVTPNDDIWVLGDFSLSKTAETIIAYGQRLHGNKHLIRGNHDHATDSVYRKAGFQSISDLRTIKVYYEEGKRPQFITLCHYAMKVWASSHHSTWHLYGHSHNTLPDDPFSLSMDVGVDCHNFTPISFDDVRRAMAKKLYVPKDHHGTRDFDQKV